MEDTQYDQFHVIDGISEVSFRTAPGQGADYKLADSYIAVKGKGAEVYIVGTDGIWWKRTESIHAEMYWEPIKPPELLVMYRLVNH